jgi:hypothetical protein
LFNGPPGFSHRNSGIFPSPVWRARAISPVAIFPGSCTMIRRPPPDDGDVKIGLSNQQLGKLTMFNQFIVHTRVHIILLFESFFWLVVELSAPTGTQWRCTNGKLLPSLKQHSVWSRTNSKKKNDHRGINFPNRDTRTWNRSIQNVLKPRIKW